jgi:urease accessory protein
MNRGFAGASAAAGVFGSPAAAHAHHFMDNALPQTFWDGLLSGLGHPLIGLDHAAFILAAGFFLARGERGQWGIAALICGGLLGALAHLNGLDLPGGEVAIALSVICIGALLLARPAIQLGSMAAGMALAGALHGYAYAESIAGAEQTPLGAYLVGFSLMQYLIAGAAFLLHRYLLLAPARWAFPAAATLGLSAVGVGALLLFANLAMIGQ